MLGTTTDPLPGIYPLITHRDPLQKRSGVDNLGMGYTEHGEQFMLKPGGRVGAAEFIGARVADACGLPACQPTIVTIETLGGQQHVFGSRIEAGVHSFDQSSPIAWQAVLKDCHNTSAFSALLAVDLVLGNDDRHWNNWLVQAIQDKTGKNGYRLRAMDFSRSWPTLHPAQHPLHHAHPNTWSATRDWSLLGASFDQGVFHATCAKIATLPARWLRRTVLADLTGVFLTVAEVDSYCLWWENHLSAQVVETIHSLENGVRP